MDEPTVTISLREYEQLLKYRNALTSNKRVVLITSYDGYSSGKIVVEEEAWESIEKRLKEVIEDYWEMLSASTDYNTADKKSDSIFKTLLRKL